MLCKSRVYSLALADTYPPLPFQLVNPIFLHHCCSVLVCCVTFFVDSPKHKNTIELLYTWEGSGGEKGLVS